MKKFLICVALAGLMAAPAMAELSAPMQSQQPMEGGARLIPYTPGTEKYDLMDAALGGPIPGRYAWGAGAFSWALDDLNGIESSGSFTHAHMIMQGGATTGVRTQMIGYFSNASQNTHVGAPLLTTGGGPAVFMYTGMAPFTPGYARSYTFSHPPVVTPNHKVWMGILTFDGAFTWGDIYSPTIFPGQVGTSYVGTSSLLPAGFVFSAPTTPGAMPTIISGAIPSTAIGGFNWSVALGVPEPATIAVLAIGGLLALRRRRA